MLPPLSLNSIMNCIQSVVLQPRGLHFHIDGFWKAGKLDATVVIFFFSPFFGNIVGRELNPEDLKKPLI